MQGWHALVIEWYLAANQNVQDDAETPDIYFGSRVSSRLK